MYRTVIVLGSIKPALSWRLVPQHGKSRHRNYQIIQELERSNDPNALHIGSVPWGCQSPEWRAALPPRRPQDEAATLAGREGAAADPLRRVLRLQLPEVSRALPAVGGGRPARGRAPARVRVRHLRQVR